MKPRLVALFLLIVVLPIGVLAALAFRIARDEREMVEHRLQSVMAGALDDVRGAVARLMAQRFRETGDALRLPSLDPQALRDAGRRNLAIRQVFVLDGKGRLAFPTTAIPLRPSEEQFLERTRGVWEGGGAFLRTGSDRVATATQTLSLPASLQQADSARSGEDSGWYPWYRGTSLHLIFWSREAGGEIVGAELDHVRLLADIIALLPQTDPLKPNPADGAIALIDAGGNVIYQWGGYAVTLPSGQQPRATVWLDAPLHSWRLEYHAPQKLFSAGRQSLFFNLAAGVGGLALALIGLAAYFYRENSRELREATRRVSFVNQVSHELKTPLTNIRMYAELLDREIPDDSEKARSQLEVIVSESQRLSRLIGNILTFSRKERDSLVLRYSVGVIDDVAQSVIANFQPSLGACGVKVDFTASAGGKVRFDADALGQILGNLFSNVEKYAGAGGVLSVTSRQAGETTTIVIADNGPGIPESQQENVFAPFTRLRNELTEGVTGTGIGLSIARDLARLHGGDLRLLPGSPGAAFELTMKTPAASAEGAFE